MRITVIKGILIGFFCSPLTWISLHHIIANSKVFINSK